MGFSAHANGQSGQCSSCPGSGPAALAVVSRARANMAHRPGGLPTRPQPVVPGLGAHSRQRLGSHSRQGWNSCCPRAEIGLTSRHPRTVRIAVIGTGSPLPSTPKRPALPTCQSGPPSQPERWVNLMSQPSEVSWLKRISEVTWLQSDQPVSAVKRCPRSSAVRVSVAMEKSPVVAK